jgi:ubiquinone/menaquinone biosynthesis C-methylase UbiE
VSTPLDRRVNDNPSTYFVQDRKNHKELTRVTIQDRMVTASMGGVLLEQPDPTVFHRVLDVGCGTGSWLIEAALTYPEMSLVGIDISQRMIKYARAQAKDHHVDEQVEFHVMDALRPLDFPAAYFDLVNLRFGISYVRTWDWLTLLTELLRVTRVDGVVRVTDCELIHQDNSPALTQLVKMLQCALYRAGHLFTDERAGLIDHLARLLYQCGYERVQTFVCTMEYRAGTSAAEAFAENMKLAFQTSRPFIQKWGCASENYDAIYQQALKEMRQPDFFATLNMLTAWGSKPGSKS